MLSNKSKIRVGIFADDIDRKAMGTTLVLQRLVAQYLDNFSDQVEVALIYKEGKCVHPLCERAQKVPVKLFRLPKFAGFFSYLWFFLFTKERFDIVHYLRPSFHPFFWLMRVLGKTKKIAATFHGAPDNKDIPIYQTFFNRFNRWLITWFGQYFLDAAIADSKLGVEQIANYYKISPKKIPAIYLGVEETYQPLLAAKKSEAQKVLAEKYQIPFPYILTVARLDPHKNIHRLLGAFYFLKEKYKIPHKLVIVGGKHEPDYTKNVEWLIENSPYGQDVYPAPYIGEKDMPALYGLAEVFAYFSLSEGFGLPVVEAMASGTPTALSNISVMPEIGGEAAVYADPYNAHAIGEAIYKILQDENLRRDLIKKGLERAKFFFWKKTAKETVELYERLLKM